MLLFAIALFYFLYLIREDILQRNGLISERTALLARISTITQKNDELSDTLAKNDKNLERLARERLNMAKKGEIVYKICR